MQKLLSRAALMASVLALAASPAAMASGGKLFGGGATGGGGGGGGGSATSTGGGGGGSGSGGGGGGGGANDATAPAPTVAAPCAALVNVSAPVGYYLTYAALWNDFTIKSCSASPHSVTIHVTNTNRATGVVDFDYTGSYLVGSSSNVNGIIDNDFAPFNTDYDVKIDATDENGNLLGSASTVATTPSPR